MEEVEKREETVSGIIIPKNQEGSEGGTIGTVIAVGEGRQTDTGTVIKPKVAVGQKIIFSWGEKVEINGKEYRIVSEGSMLGILNTG